MAEYRMHNCLRCRACSLLPETDMAQPRPVIFCGKLGHAREINLGGCLATQDDAPTRRISTVEGAWIRAYYATDTSGWLARSTGRPSDSIRHTARRLGVKCAPGVRATRSGIVRQQNSRASGQTLNEAQAQALSRARTEGRYPIAGGPTRGVAGQAQVKRNAALRVALLRELRMLGPVARWEVIPIYVGNNSPSQKRRARARLAP